MARTADRPDRSDRSTPSDAFDAGLTPPKHPTWIAALVYFVATMTLAYPGLAGTVLLNPRSDQYIAGYPFREFAAQSLRHGHGFPMWNPFIQGGLPYIAAMHGDIFYPTFLMRLVMPTDLAMTWEFPIHIFLAGLLTYFFLRAWRVGFYGALVGGLSYMLGGSLAGLASPGHDGKLFVAALMPLVLLLLTRGVRDGLRWSWGALALAVGLALLSPHPQVFQYMMLLGGAFALYVAFAEHPGQGRLPTDVAVRRLALALGAVIVGCLIGAIQFYPAAIEYVPWSPRAGGHDFATAASYSFPIEETINAYLPQFSGILDHYWGRNSIHFHSDYFGVVALVLMTAAFGRSAFSSFKRFWVGAGIVSLIWAYGGYTPFYKLIILIPGTKYFRAPSTIIFITAFAVAVVAAVGVERILAGRVGKRFLLGWGIAGVLVALLMSVGGYSALVNGVANSMAGDYPPEAHGQIVGIVTQRADPNTGAAILGAWRSCAVVLITIGIIWGLLTDRLKARGAVIALAALLVVDLWSIERLYWIFSPRATTLYATDPAIEAIRADAMTGPNGRVAVWPDGEALEAASLGRVLPWATGAGIAPRDPAFSGDALMVHGLRVPEGYHGNELAMYRDLTSLDSGNVVLSPQFWRHENVKYLYTDLDEQSMSQIAGRLGPAAPVTRLAGPVRDAAGSMVYAYKLALDAPLATVATSIVKATPAQALGTILDPRFETGRVAIADSSATNVQAQPLSALPAAAPQRADVAFYAPDEMRFSLSGPSTTGEALVVSENYFPGWHATVDGRPAVVARMNYNLIGVVLPAGAKSVDLRFTDAAYESGKWITLGALILALIAWGAGFAAGRGRQVAAAAA
jgi:hypothetical protein